MSQEVAVRIANIVVTSQLVLIVAAIATINSIAQEPRSFVVRHIESPAAVGSGEPNLFVSGDRVFLSWIEPARTKGHALRFSMREREKWSEPRTIADGANWFVNWADFPSLVALPDESLVAHWLVKNGEGAHGYDINIARSTDGG